TVSVRTSILEDLDLYPPNAARTPTTPLITKSPFIVGSRTSSAPYDLAEHYATVGNITIDGETVDTTRKMGKGAQARVRRVVWQYSHKRKRRDNITLNKQIERAEQIAAGTRPAKKDRFVTLGEKPTVNQARIDKAREYIGLKGYVTNLAIAKVPAAEVVAAYHDLFQVEASFRMAKTDLRARPMFASTAESISAHLTIVFSALAISRHLYASSGVTIRRIVRALRPLRDVTISIDGHQLTATTPPEGEAADIVAALQPSPGH
ncbi:IS1634 family transposase, partial [Microbacterium gubbeenense]|uniref:IS1634 family transposase n=1 Tax=Microbacterium gubbeenense TaxID=159896 RepID=UPI003CCC3C74